MTPPLSGGLFRFFAIVSLSAQSRQFPQHIDLPGDHVGELLSTHALLEHRQNAKNENCQRQTLGQTVEGFVKKELMGNRSIVT